MRYPKQSSLWIIIHDPFITLKTSVILKHLLTQITLFLTRSLKCKTKFWSKFNLNVKFSRRNGNSNYLTSIPDQLHSIFSILKVIVFGIYLENGHLIKANISKILPLLDSLQNWAFKDLAISSKIKIRTR